MKDLRYVVYCDDKVIYDVQSESLVLIDPVLVLEDNAPGSFSFSIAKTHPLYNELKILKSTIKIVKFEPENDPEILFEGRITEDTADFYGTRQIYCAGALSYLTDSVQGFCNYNGVSIRHFLRELIRIHNTQVDENRQFEYLNNDDIIVTVTDSNNDIYKRTNYDDTLTCINEKLLKSFGGHIRVRYDYSTGKRYIDYLANWVDECTQKIEFGKNLLDFSQTIDVSDLCTVVIPLGVKPNDSDERLTIKAVNSGSDYLTANQAAIDLYGRVSKVVIWDDVTVASNLKTKGQNYLQETQYENLVLECTAVDLNKMDVQIESLKLLQEVWVYSSPHGLDKKFPITKLTLNFAYPEKDTVTLGSKQQRSFTSSSVSANTEIVEKINNMPTKYQILEDAKANATAILNAATHGYVVVESDKILIMNNSDQTEATQVWKWNVSGLGYSSNGYNGPYTTAITMDGKICADFITTGTLSANRVRTGILESQDGQNYFNLSTGKLHCVNAELSGSFTSGDGTYKTYIDSGSITQYLNSDNPIGGLVPTGNELGIWETLYFTNHNNVKGIHISRQENDGSFNYIADFRADYIAFSQPIVVNGSKSSKGVGLTHYYSGNFYGLPDSIEVKTKFGCDSVRYGNNSTCPAAFISVASDSLDSNALAALYIYESSGEAKICIKGAKRGSLSRVLELGDSMWFGGDINATAFNVSSTEDIKENITVCTSMSDVLKNGTVYKYNLIEEESETVPQGEQEGEQCEPEKEAEPKDHIGLIINEDLPEILLSEDGRHIDLYTMLSINWKVTQEILTRLEALEGSNQNG